MIRSLLPPWYRQNTYAARPTWATRWFYSRPHTTPEGIAQNNAPSSHNIHDRHMKRLYPTKDVICMPFSSNIPLCIPCH